MGMEDDFLLEDEENFCCKKSSKQTLPFDY